MKTAIKIAIWFGMITTWFLIFPVVIGIIALNKLDSVTSKEELKTIGILTLIFCSTLAGVLMLCLKNEDLELSSNTTRVIYKTKVIETQSNPQTIKNLKMINILSITILVICGILSFVFALLPNCKYNSVGEVGVIAFIFSCVILFLLVIILITLSCCKFRHNIPTYILSIISLGLSIAVIVLSILATEECGIRSSSSFEYYYAWEFWITFGCSCAVVAITSFTVILNLLMKKKTMPHKVVKEKVVVNKMESELSEVNTLLKNKVITKEEYDRIRKLIISKYYKI